VTIRKGTADDFDAVLDLWTHARSAAASTPDGHDVLTTLLARDRDSLLLAEDDGDLVGTAIAAFDGFRGGLYRVAVAPGHRRRGIGSALVREAEHSLRERGCIRISIITGAGEEDALAFWAALGYTHNTDMARLSKNLH
jgi:ribosomal protein S18 acetylase RimI-like enzyme